MSKKVFITGIAGLLGSHLARTLSEQGWEVSGADSGICGDFANIPSSVHYWIKMDVCDNERLARELRIIKPDVVVHCAATAAEGLSVFSPSFITRNIFEASVSVFSAAIAAGAKRIVNFSSMSRYGKGDPPFTEDSPLNPIDPYAVSKVAAEKVLQILCDAHGVKWTICCPHNVCGPGQEISSYRNVATIFLNRLRIGSPIYVYGDGLQKRSFSPIRDCLPTLVKMVEGEADGEVINIGPDGQEITIIELLEMCKAVTGLTTDIIHLPPRPLTDEVKEAYCSSDKARKLLGYEPVQSVRDCLVEMNTALKPRQFVYNFPVEIERGCPETWLKKLP